MNDSIEQCVARVNEGTASVEDFQTLRRYLSHVVGGYVYEPLVAYLEHAPIVDWQIATKFGCYREDPMIAAAAISAAGLRGCPDEAFWRVAKQVALGTTWDETNDARVQAILVLHKMPRDSEGEVKKILLAALDDPSPSLRDSAAIAAQRCFGVPEPNIIVGGEDGTLVERISPEAKRWLIGHS